MGKQYRANAKRNKQHRRAQPATSGDWERLHEDEVLRSAYTQLVQSLMLSQYAAEEQSRATGRPLEEVLDLRSAVHVLNQYPQLTRYLDDVRDKEAMRQEALGELDITRANPTGGSRGGNQGTLGGWAGTATDKNNPIGVNNARRLRDWSEGDEWVNSALNFLSGKVSRADVAVLPNDERKPFSRAVFKSVEQIIDQPNEVRDSWPMLLGMFTRDLLTLGQGVFTKSMTPRRAPIALYCEDAANIKIYPGWSGDPDEPRYLYQEPGFSGLGQKTPLRNDEAIVALYNPTTYRFGMGPVQVLADTIVSDMKATEAAMRMVDHKPPPTAIQLQGFSAEQIKKVRATYESEVAGRREILFFGGDKPMAVAPLIFSMKDQQFMEWQEYLLRKICAVFQVAPQDLGWTEHVTKATAESQMDISDLKGFIPLLLLIEEYLNRELLADFAPKAANGRTNMAALNLRIVFPEVSEAARMMHIEKVISMATEGLVGLPSMTLNMALEVMGQPPVAHGNTFYWPSTAGLIPVASYDGEISPFATVVGMQDAAGGVNESTDDVNADDQSDDDMGSDGESSQGDGQTTPAAPTASPIDGASTSGSPDGSTNGQDAQKRLSIRSTVKSTPRLDTRKPGTAWSSTLLTRAAPPTPRRVSRAVAEKYARPADEVAARSQLEAAIKKVFGEVEQRGRKKLEE